MSLMSTIRTFFFPQEETRSRLIERVNEATERVERASKALTETLKEEEPFKDFAEELRGTKKYRKRSRPK